jgi:hypothetical protein
MENNMLMKCLVLVLSGYLLSGCASGLSISWAKQGVNFQTFSNDVDICRLSAEEAKKNVGMGYHSTNSIGGTFAAGFDRAAKKAKVARQAEEECFSGRGYEKVELTKAEKSVFKSLKNKKTQTEFLHKIATK